jgi:hypothetical protein
MFMKIFACVYIVLRIEPRASHMPGMHCSTEPHSQALFVVLSL